MWPCLLSSFLHFVWAGDAVALCGVGNVVFIAIVIDKREGVEEKVGRDCSCKEHGGFATDIYTCLCSMRLLLCHSLRER